MRQEDAEVDTGTGAEVDAGVDAEVDTGSCVHDRTVPCRSEKAQPMRPPSRPGKENPELCEVGVGDGKEKWEL